MTDMLWACRWNSGHRAATRVVALVALATAGGISCGNSASKDVREPRVVKLNSVPSALVSSSPSIAPPPSTAPSCDAAKTNSEKILKSAITPRADYIVVVRESGCLETWSVEQKKQVATAHIDLKKHIDAFDNISVYMTRWSVLVIGGTTALDAHSLSPVKMPSDEVEAEPAFKTRDSAVGLLNLDPKLGNALRKWASRMSVDVKVEGKYTWIVPQTPKLGEPPMIQVSSDGKLLASDARLVRLDIDKKRDYVSWTDSFTAMSDETFPATISFVFGPRSDRVVVLSTARMGAGTSISSAHLEDTKTMRTIAVLADACADDDGYWSPLGKWFVRRPCDHGVLSSEIEATFADEGRPIRKFSSTGVAFAADDEIAVSAGIVMQLKTGEILLQVPQPAETSGD